MRQKKQFVTCSFWLGCTYMGGRGSDHHSGSAARPDGRRRPPAVMTRVPDSGICMPQVSGSRVCRRFAGSAGLAACMGVMWVTLNRL